MVRPTPTSIVAMGFPPAEPNEGARISAMMSARLLSEKVQALQRSAALKADDEARAALVEAASALDRVFNLLGEHRLGQASR